MIFTKMQGAGNDYVYVNCVEYEIEDRPQLAIQVSDRNFGIGSDGLICICPSLVADFKMDMYNADGSSSGMCGNGIRCVGKYVFDKGMTDKKVLTIETLSGIKTLWLNVEDGLVKTVRVDMGSPYFRPSDIPVVSERKDFIAQPVQVDGQVYEVTALSVGNPHAVIFVDDVDAIDLETIGPLFEKHPLFPEYVNTEFVEILGPGELKMRVWERGSGETLACGTGATAVLAAAAVTGRAGDSAKLLLRGGKLFIEWDRVENKLYMTGSAVTVFEGELL